VGAADLLRGVDRAAFAVAFALRLREEGIAIGLPAIETFTLALSSGEAETLSKLYWLARVSLIRRQPDVVIFDRVFAAVFDDVVLRLDPNSRRRAMSPEAEARWAQLPAPTTVQDDEPGAGLPWATLPKPTETTEADADEAEIMVPERLPSRLEALGDVPFDQLDPEDLALLGDWFAQALSHWPTRRSRRMVTHPAGRTVSLRPTLAAARRTGWEPIELVRTRPQRRPRRVVMLSDISQSMQPYAAAYLHLMRASVIATDAEVFAFATSLTRLTPVLRHRSVAEAIKQAEQAVTDRFGGTRIATNLHTLLHSRHGGLTRGAIVIIASDGWDSDDPADLAAGMARLRRLAHRVIWMNPRAAAPGYAPLVGAMAAALPYCDALVPAHTLRTMADVLAAITRAH